MKPVTAAGTNLAPVRAFRLRRLLAGLALAFPLAATAADIELSVSPLAAAQGSLMVAVYNSEASFRKDAVAQQKIAAAAGTMTVRFSNLPPGDYAIALFHDVNDNGKLDANLLGIPKEPYGFSKLEKALMGPPGWNEVKFTVPAEGARLAVALR